MISVNELIDEIDVRSEYDHRAKMLCMDSLALTAEDLNAQLKKHVHTALAEVPTYAKTQGYVLVVQVSGDNIVIAFPEGVDAMDGALGKMEAAVKEFLKNEAAYLWWMDVNPEVADGSARLLLRNRIKQTMSGAIPANTPPKRELKRVFVPEGTWIWE